GHHGERRPHRSAAAGPGVAGAGRPGALLLGLRRLLRPGRAHRRARCRHDIRLRSRPAGRRTGGRRAAGRDRGVGGTAGGGHPAAAHAGDLDDADRALRDRGRHPGDDDRHARADERQPGRAAAAARGAAAARPADGGRRTGQGPRPRRARDAAHL
ncbi:MAG: hypothetical protein AVDCRST_MAG52-90, partial [uncultured Blastococcus sp.]